MSVWRSADGDPGAKVCIPRQYSTVRSAVALLQQLDVQEAAWLVAAPHRAKVPGTTGRPLSEETTTTTTK